MSFLFDGTNDSLSGTFTSTYNATGLTLACKFKFTTHPGVVDALVMFGNSGSSVNDSQAIQIQSTADTYRSLATDSAGTTNTCLVTANRDNTWASLVGTFTSATLRDLYLDSTGTTDQSTTNRVVANVMQFIRIGENLAGGADYTGRIAEVAIWKSVLSSGNITNYMNGVPSSQIDASNLIGYWPLSSSSLANLGVDAGGTLSIVGNATFDADHPSMIGGSQTHKRRMLMGMG